MPDQDEIIRRVIDSGVGQAGDTDGVLRELAAAGFTIVPATNPRETIGRNFPPLARSIADESEDFAMVVTRFLEDEYRQYPIQMQQLLDGAENLPESITAPEDKEATVTVIKNIRDLVKKFVAFHEKEKAPYLRGGQGVDQFFFGMIDQLLKRSRTARAGIGDTLLQRLTDYDNRLIAEERERLRIVAEQTARDAEEARKKAVRDAEEAEEKRQAAERARNPERIAERTAEANEAEQRASTANIQATVTAARAEQAHIDTLITTPEITRTRTAGGDLATTGTEKYATLIDKRLVDKEVLWPFIPATEIEKALRAWAKTTDHNTPMAGAEIGRRNKARVR